MDDHPAGAAVGWPYIADMEPSLRARAARLPSTAHAAASLRASPGPSVSSSVADGAGLPQQQQQQPADPRGALFRCVCFLLYSALHCSRRASLSLARLTPPLRWTAEAPLGTLTSPFTFCSSAATAASPTAATAPTPALPLAKLPAHLALALGPSLLPSAAAGAAPARALAARLAVTLLACARLGVEDCTLYDVSGAFAPPLPLPPGAADAEDRGGQGRLLPLLLAELRLLSSSPSPSSSSSSLSFAAPAPAPAAAVAAASSAAANTAAAVCSAGSSAMEPLPVHGPARPPAETPSSAFVPASDYATAAVAVVAESASASGSTTAAAVASADEVTFVVIRQGLTVAPTVVPTVSSAATPEAMPVPGRVVPVLAACRADVIRAGTRRRATVVRLCTDTSVGTGGISGSTAEEEAGYAAASDADCTATWGAISAGVGTAAAAAVAVGARGGGGMGRLLFELIESDSEASAGTGDASVVPRAVPVSRLRPLHPSTRLGTGGGGSGGGLLLVSALGAAHGKPALAAAAAALAPPPPPPPCPHRPTAAAAAAAAVAAAAAAAAARARARGAAAVRALGSVATHSIGSETAHAAIAVVFATAAEAAAADAAAARAARLGASADDGRTDAELPPSVGHSAAAVAVRATAAALALVASEPSLVLRLDAPSDGRQGDCEPARTLLGFPPWLLRLAEVQFATLTVTAPPTVTSNAHSVTSGALTVAVGAHTAARPPGAMLLLPPASASAAAAAAAAAAATLCAPVCRDRDRDPPAGDRPARLCKTSLVWVPPSVSPVWVEAELAGALLAYAGSTQRLGK